MVRILVCGEPGDKFEKVSQRLASLNTKSGPFEFVILLSAPGALPETFSCPLPTYFAHQECENSSVGREVRPNLFYVGPCSNLRIHDLNLVLLAEGYDDPKSATLPPEVETAIHRAGGAGAGFRGVDVLISPSIPCGIEINKERSQQSGLVAEVALRLRPRYHFVSASQFIALPTFSCPNTDHGTRLLAIAHIDAPKRSGTSSKWVYAADIAPLDFMTDEERTDTAPKLSVRAPYGSVVSKTGNENLHAAVARITQEVMSGSENDQFFWRIRGQEGKRRLESRSHLSERRKKARRASVETPVDAACWFCLSNGKDAHLVVDVGEHMYLAMAKGGINDDHLLIVPIDHVHSSGDRRLSEEMARELEVYKKCIQTYFEEALNGAKGYFFERSITTRGGAKQMHMHVNAIPIPKEFCKRVLQNAEAAAGRFSIALKRLKERQQFQTPAGVTTVAGEESGSNSDPAAVDSKVVEESNGRVSGAEEASSGEGVTKEESSSPSKDMAQHGRTPVKVAPNTEAGTETHVARVRREVDEGEEYFYAELPCGTRLLHIQNVTEDGQGKHPLHFGRAVAAAALGRPDLVDWKVCVEGAKVETDKTEQLRDRINKFLPVL